MSPPFDSLRLLMLVALSGLALGLSGCGSTLGTRPAGSAGGVADGSASQAQDADARVPERAMVSYNRALDAMRAADWTEAELELEQLTLAYPDYAGPHVNLAIVYMATGRDAEAETALTQALSLNPRHAQAFNQLGILARRQGRFDAAEQAYQDALAADPNYALAHFNLGVLLDLYLSRPADALSHYEAYQSLLPEADPTVAKWIVDLRRRLGVTETAARVAPEEAS